MADDKALGLIGTVIRSVWDLEMMVLMRRQPERVWPAETLVHELRASAPLVAETLRGLVAGGLVREEAGGFVYGPASPALETACAQLEEAYRQRPVAIVNLIVSATANKVQGFADAFRFKRGDE